MSTPYDKGKLAAMLGRKTTAPGMDSEGCVAKKA